MAKLMLEEQAFRAQQAALRKLYPGQLVAVHEGRVVDSGRDRLELHNRVVQKYPGEAVLICSVDWTPVVEEMSTPFEPEEHR